MGATHRHCTATGGSTHRPIIGEPLGHHPKQTKKAWQVKHGISPLRPCTVCYPSRLYLVVYTHTRPVHVHASTFAVVRGRSAWYPISCHTGLLKGRKRQSRTHRRQYTPMSWIEA